MKLEAAFVIAGTSSGCGKTTVSLGITAALTARGFCVQPFKVGPDFIDPGHHAMVAGRSSVNLDGWMMDREYNRQVFFRHAAGAGVAVVEGVMGLYDGFSAVSDSGSTAQIAKWLGLPVVLVIDASAMARSAAAVALGFIGFDPGLSFAGVILNNVAGKGHARILQEAFENVAGVPVLGCLERCKEVSIPSRHLGLVTALDMPADSPVKKSLAKWVEGSVDMERLLSRARIREIPGIAPGAARSSRGFPAGRKKVRIGVAKDEAFCFYYLENFRLLEEAGAELIFFSPLHDKGLPPGIKGMIIGGGYPELHCSRLASNTSMLREIRAAAAAQMPVYAECGGFMYLMEGIKDLQGRYYGMAGLFPFCCRMEPRLRSLGYREVVTRGESVLGPEGTVIRGHEFHYSTICEKPDSSTTTIYRISDRKGQINRVEGFTAGLVLGSYIHLHWGSAPEVAGYFVEYCRIHG